MENPPPSNENAKRIDVLQEQNSKLVRCPLFSEKHRQNGSEQIGLEEMILTGPLGRTV